MNNGSKASTTGKAIIVKPKLNVLSKPANENGGGSSKASNMEPVLSENEAELSDRLEDVINDNNRIIAPSTFDNDQTLNDKRSETSSIGDIQECQNSLELLDDPMDSEQDDLQDNCLEDVLKEVNKDIGALYSKTNKIEADLKEIKQILLTPHLNIAFEQYRHVLSKKRHFHCCRNFHC